MGIHPTAIVEPGAELGPDVDIGPYCTVGPRVRIGARTRLVAHVVVDGDTVIGEDCELYPFCVIGTTPQDKKLKADTPAAKLRIGSHNKIREHVTIHGGTPFGGGTTTVGDHNMLLVGAHIGHDATVGSHVVFTNGAMAAGHTVIGDRAILGAMVGIHQFARVGKLAMIGAGAMVSHDAPPFAMVQGDRAKLVAVNVVGLHRNGFTAEQKALVKRVFRLLFWRAGTLHQRLEFVRCSSLHKDPICREIVDFVAESRRGVCSPRSQLRSHSAGDESLGEGAIGDGAASL
ncbi:MAG: acyl-ACP--UDP-N-acetylglucosamine O-acyltransferase [Planctomycetes bacterium]|nr:acyl-ACP--UDP-N-acetylglucosamine O-acyltransferase [Planctomycetota bacterium]